MGREDRQRRPAEDRLQSRGLAEGLRKWQAGTEKPKPAPAARPATNLPARPPRQAPKTRAEREAEFDEHLFAMAMEGVSRIGERPADRRAPPPAEARPVDDEAEALAQLAELVATGSFDVSDTDEYMEGVAGGVDRSLLVRLSRGDFSVQAHVDLHGLSVDAAKEALEKFLVESRRAGHRCVLVVHGRGLHSREQEPVLKPRLGAWLSKGRLGRLVLAFATARPVDGGAGALYVLLRR